MPSEQTVKTLIEELDYECKDKVYSPITIGAHHYRLLRDAALAGEELAEILSRNIHEHGDSGDMRPCPRQCDVRRAALSAYRSAVEKVKE